MSVPRGEASSTHGSAPRGSLQPVTIQELKALADGRCWELDGPLDGLDTLTPVRGSVRVIHRGNVLEVEGQANTIVTLCCDRCLQHFNRPLGFDTRELLWLGEEARQQGLETSLVEEGSAVLDLDPDSLSESIDPLGSFDPAHWTFEQLSLQLPVVNQCGSDCPGPASWGSQGSSGDPRWAALAKLMEPPGEP
jgi:uncharacterized protein